MSLLVPINGQNYIIPETNEVGWGSNLDDFFVAISAGVLQKTGGSFTLSAETDFGASYGLKSLYYKSRATNVAATGAIRLANAETGVVWRNFLNNADLALTVNASNQLTFNGTPLQSNSLASAHILVGSGSNIATDVAMSGDIGISNAGLTTIQSGVVTSAKIASNTITNSNINSAAAIAYSKLALTGSIVNADVSSSAAIGITKIANGTANQVLGTNAGASANEWKTLTATSNQVSVTHGVGTVTFATPQDIGTSSAVRFGSLTLGGALDASSILSLTSTTKGFLPPVMTTTQKNAISSPTDGLVVYDSSLAQLFLRSASAWTPLSVGGGSGTVASGSQYQLGYYASAGTTISGNSNIITDASGNFGIGSIFSTAFSKTLTLSAGSSPDVNAALIIQGSRTAGTGTIGGISFVNSTTPASAIFFSGDGTATGGKLIFQTKNGAAAIANSLTLNADQSATFANDVAVTRSSTGTVLQTISNTNAANVAAHAELSLETDPLGGDPWIRFLTTGATAWSMGIDNSDSDHFKIQNSNGLSTGTATGIDIAASGSIVFYSNALTAMILDSTQHAQFIDGTVGSPAITFASDTDTGIYHVAANRMAVVAGGNTHIDVNDGANYVYLIGTARFDSGLVATPGITFNSDTASGMYLIGTSNIALATAGVKALEITSTQQVNIGNTKLVIGGNQSYPITQIVQGTSTTEFDTTNTVYQTTNLSASITPKFNTSKILIQISGNIAVASGTNADASTISIFRGSTNLELAAGGGFATATQANGQTIFPVSISYYDSPATTSATTYSVKLKTSNARSQASFGWSTTAQVIILTEIAQ